MSVARQDRIGSGRCLLSTYCVPLRNANGDNSDQGREFENKVMQELCIMCGSHKTKTTPYHPESDGLVERFIRTLLMMFAMFAGENPDDWDDLLPAVMMAYRSGVHESTGFSPYRLMLGEECMLPMDVSLPRHESDLPDPITSP